MNAPAQPVPQAMPLATWPQAAPIPPKVVAAIAEAQRLVEPVQTTGQNVNDPSDPYSYAPADKVIAAGKKAAGEAGLLVLPLGETAKVEAVTAHATWVWLTRWFRVTHLDSGDYYDFYRLWVLPPNKTADKALPTAETSSLAFFFRDLLLIERVGVNIADDADSTEPKSAEAKPEPRKGYQGPSGKRLSMLTAEKSSPREVVDPETLKAELDKAALEAFGGEPVNSGPDPAMPPTPADELKDVASNPSASVGAVPAEVLQPESGNTPAGTETLVPPASGTSSEAGHSNSGPNFLDQGEWAGVKSESSAGGESLTEQAKRDTEDLLCVQTPGASDGTALLTVESLKESDWDPDGATPERGRPVGSKAPPVLSKRVAESKAAPWAKSVERKARKAFWCDECQKPGDTVVSRPEKVDEFGAIKKGDKHRDGSAGRCCLKCYSGLMEKAAQPAGEVA